MKTALIVDDSRLARTVLSRLLTEHGVAADTAPTAEAALEYLKGRRPDVVFLDHNMPGMDGFEALEAIKANPATATIPVMMYTSQEGELYVGQARALGALGVLPKSLHPVEVTKVLRSLHLIPGEELRANGSQPMPEAQRLRELIEELFYEQAAVLREEIRSELRRAAAAKEREALPPAELTAPAPTAASRGWRLAAVTAAAAAVVLGALHVHTAGLLRAANERTARLAAETAALASANAAALAGNAAAAERFDPVGLLEWAANRGNRYPFGAVALDDARAAELTELLTHLEQSGFTGTVAVDVHVGRYCMSYREDGSLAPAAAELPAAACDQIGWPALEAIAIGGQQSVGFANTIAAATRGKALTVATESLGSAAPLLDYPLPGYDLTAAEWNEIADANQRIEIRLLPAAER